MDSGRHRVMDILLSDSEWDTVSESGSSEDQEEIEFLYGGQAQSILSSLDESIGKIDDFLSFERGFVYGDTVCAVADPSGQMGRVENVNMLVDLENLRGQIMKDVNSKKLSKIRSISVGDHVIYGSWLGRVTKVVDCVTVLFDDGAKCEVTVNGEEKLIPTSPNLLEDSQYLYYPGQRVRMRSSAASTSARWLCGTWKGNQTAGTVCGVKPGLIYVDWLASVLDGPESRCRAPPCLQDPEKLTLLSCFSHASWQLGDWCMLPKADNMDPLNSTSYDFSEDHNDGRKEFTRDFNSNVEDIFVIVKTKTKIDVLWQDGSRSRGLDSQTLLPKDVVNAHEFLPGQFVLEKSAIEDQSNPAKNRWGFVRSVDAKEQIVEVTWKFRHSTGINDASQDWTEETVSAYELIEHPDYSYSFGDVVFRLAGNDDLENNCEDNGEDIGKCYLSCIGIVTGIRDGNVEVEWAVGPKSKVAPSEVFRLSKDEGPAETSTICEENVEQTNQEPIQQERQSLIDKGKGLSDAYCDIDQSKNCCWESSSFSLPRCAIGAFSSLLGNLFGSFSPTLFGGPMSTSLVYEDDQKCGALNEKQEASDICTETQPMLINEFQASERSTSEVGVEEIHKIKDVLHSSVGMFPDKFRQFDMVTDCSDHCFLDSAGRGCAPTQVQRNWLKKVQQEWSILEKNLPETIYVRVYEERIDLMRAALVGSPGTPYHDGLFFFDIYLPPEYPNEPPSVFYHSGGLRINPNLYESGKVCLSLLNTWTGTGTEVWNPGSSTILQVLLSLQALVLNEKPYFNEAGYDLQIGKAEGEKNSVSYNENAFLVTCKSMLYLLRKPPKNFEDLVEEHFRKCSQRILMACKAYMDGAPVGCAFGNIDTGSKKGSSTGFKIMLGKILPKVVEAFADKGIDCSHFQP